MIGWLARRGLNRFEKRYGYDSTYMRVMLEEAPSAFYKFSLVQAAAEHRKVVAPEAYFATKVTAALVTDCGPCTQLCVDMALENGVAADQLAAVVNKEVAEMSGTTALGYRFARAVAENDVAEAEAARVAVRERWGEAGVVELSLCYAVGQVFPTLKAAMGHGLSCQLVRIGEIQLAPKLSGQRNDGELSVASVT